MSVAVLEEHWHGQHCGTDQLQLAEHAEWVGGRWRTTLYRPQ